MNVRNKGISRLFCCGTLIIWGSMFVIADIALAYIPALLMLFFRFALSGTLLIAAARARGAAWIAKKDWGRILAAGVCGYFTANAAMLFAIQYAGAAFSSLINATCPIFIALFASLLLGERMDKKGIAALILAVAGEGVLVGSPTLQASGFGIFMAFLCTLSWSLATVLLKDLNGKYDAVMITGTGMAIAAVLCLPSAFVQMQITGERVVLSPALIFPFLYICLICTGVAHLMWNAALRVLDATECAVFYPLQPLTSMVMGVLLLGDRITVNTVIGTALILAAMLLRVG